MRVNNEIMDAKAGVFTAPVKWAKNWKKLEIIEGFHVYSDSEISKKSEFETDYDNKNIFSTEKQAERYGIIAAQLSQLVAQLNGEPDWMPKIDEKFYHIGIGQDGLKWSDFTYNRFMILHFPLKTQAAAEFTIKHHANLWRKFYGI